jgi:hypothetical protein
MMAYQRSPVACQEENIFFADSYESPAIFPKRFSTFVLAPRSIGKFATSLCPYRNGAIQAANVLNPARAIAMGVDVVRAFVQLRELLASNTALARKLNELEGKLKNHDETITAILSAIRELMNPPAPKRRPIGFTADLTEKS